MDHEPTPIEAAIARGPGMGSMVRFTPPPYERATMVVIKVEGSPERLHTGLGSGAPRTPWIKTTPSNKSTIVNREDSTCLNQPSAVDVCSPEGQAERRAAVPALRMPRPAEKVPMPAEKDAGRPSQQSYPAEQHFLALARVQTLLQGLGGYTRGCADAPPRKRLHTYSKVVNSMYAPVPSVIPSVGEEGGLYCSKCK